MAQRISGRQPENSKLRGWTAKNTAQIGVKFQFTRAGLKWWYLGWNLAQTTGNDLADRFSVDFPLNSTLLNFMVIWSCLGVHVFMSTRERQVYQNQRLLIAVDTLKYGPVAAARAHGCSVGKAKYNRDKLLDPDFHPGRLGGVFHTGYDDAQQALAELCLYADITINTARNITQFSLALKNLGWSLCSRKWVADVLKRWRFSLHNIKWRSPLKYTPNNIRLYVGFLESIRQYAADRVKFLDEIHAVSRGVLLLACFDFPCCSCLNWHHVCRITKASRRRAEGTSPWGCGWSWTAIFFVNYNGATLYRCVCDN